MPESVCAAVARAARALHAEAAEPRLTYQFGSCESDRSSNLVAHVSFTTEDGARRQAVLRQKFGPTEVYGRFSVLFLGDHARSYAGETIAAAVRAMLAAVDGAVAAVAAGEAASVRDVLASRVAGREP